MRSLTTVLSSVLVLASCAGEIDNPDDFSAPIRAGSLMRLCGDVELDLLRPNCGGCHVAGATGPGELDLVSPGVRSRLIGVISSCANKPYVDEVDRGAGFLFEKLRAAPACGSQMLGVNGPLSESQISCLQLWLKQPGP
jgi:hypothetical protein